MGINDNDEIGKDALTILENGDYLLIEDGNGNIEWEGRIHLTVNSANNVGYQELCGFWVNGAQVGVDPETWFIKERHYAPITN